MEKDKNIDVENIEKTVNKKAEEQPVNAYTAFRGKLKGSYPDLPDDDDDALYGKATEHLSGLEEYKSKNETINQELMNAFKAHPELADFMRDVVKGIPINQALARNFDLEALTPVEDDEDFTDYSKAKQERMEKLKKRDEMLQQTEENLGLSRKEFDAFVKENELSEEEAQKFIDMLDAFVSDALVGKVSKDMLTHFHKSITSDAEIKAAEEAAGIKAKNEKIEVIKEKEKTAGDGLPVLTAMGEPQEATKKQSDPWAESVEHAQKRRRF